MGTINCKVNGVIQRGITAAEIDDNGHLLFTLSDGTILDMGYIIGPAGRGITGVQRTAGNGSPGTYDTYTMTFTDGGTFVFQVYNGKDGVSPSVSVSNIPGGHRISITDATGTKNTDVMDGEDGVSPVVTVTQIENGYHLEIDDVTGKKVMNIYNGADGADGANGQDGADGQDGEDGFSPTVAISTIPGGHQVSITDATGTKSFTVMDGEDGEDGASASFAQGTCNTPGATAEKTVSGIAGTVQYGDIISVLFTNANTAASPTLSVGSQSYAILGANLSAVDPGLLTRGIHLFMLYGSQSASAWVLLNGGSGSYTLPVASQNTLGGVKPSGKTAGEVQPVSVDDNGALWTLPPILDGYCSTTGNTAAKVEQGFVNDAISNGRIIGIYFAHANAAGNPTLSVNGKTGPIIGEDTEPISPEALTAGMHLFVYLERYSGWWMVNSAIADSGGSGGSYTLPVASQNILGGVKAPEKTEAMTQPVGIDISGKLFVLPAEIPIGECTANGYVVYKTLSTDISRTISNGSLVAVHFSNANTAENPTLTVNGVTGPIIDSSMEAVEPEALTAGMHLFFYVQNEGWWMIKTGQDGQTPNVTIGTVQTLPAGANATAEITGTTPNLALNLGIPKGDPGEQGPKGDTGETGPQGPVGNPTAAQVKAAVEEMVDADPSLVSTVTDRSVTPVKTSFMLESYVETTPAFYGRGKYWALKSSNADYYHSWNANWNLIDSVTAGEIVYLDVVSSYVNYRFMNADPSEMTDSTTLKAAIVSFGGTYDGYTHLHNTDANAPVRHRLLLAVPDGATYLLADFGYTDPTGMIYGRCNGDYHLYPNAVWTGSIQDGAVSGVKLADGAVSEAKLENYAITMGKISDGAVSARALDIGYSNNISTRPDSPNVVKVATGVETYLSFVREGTIYPNGVMWAFHCEAGKCYRLSAKMAYESDYSELFVKPNPDGENYVNAYGFICNNLIKPIAGSFTLQDGYIAGHWLFGLSATLDPEYVTIYNNKTESYSRSIFKCNKDIWFYWCTSSDVSESAPYLDSNLPMIRECEPPSDAVIAADNWSGANAQSDRNWSGRYLPDFGSIETKQNDVALCTINGNERFDINPAIAHAVARVSRDPVDNDVRVMVIGDSITYAASNAGLQNAWRKYVSARLNLYETAVLAVSGTGIIKGAPYDWFGKAKASEDYLEDYSGYNGIVHWCKNLLGEELDYRNTWYPGTTVFESASRFEKLSMAIIALGTNDWSNGGVLGSASTLDDEATFYGAVQKTYTYLHDTLGIPTVLFVAPFKREGWATNNSAATPYTIYDMCHTLCEIACINPDMYVLDCLDRWYLNYDDTAIRSKSFIDNVHIKGYAHHMFTIDLAREIRNILSAKGFV